MSNHKVEESVPNSNPTAQKTYPNFRLIIPKIKINVPVIKNVNGSNKALYMEDLEKGVAHFAGTALPDEKNNCFIFGHSSYYYGKYKEVFKKLPSLKKGDEFSIWYKEKEYRYKISESKQVSKTNLSILAQTGEQKVTLMTCYPVGTSKARWVVIGKLY